MLIHTNCTSTQKLLLPIEECYQRNLSDSTLMTGFYFVTRPNTGFSRYYKDFDTTITINPRPIVTVEDIVKMSIGKSNYGFLYIGINFGKRGTEAWKEATVLNPIEYNYVVFVLNDSIIEMRRVVSQIPNGVSAISTRTSTLEELNVIKQKIEENQNQFK
jgi:hypothetical protein